jgi:hypothetical protein
MDRTRRTCAFVFSADISCSSLLRGGEATIQDKEDLDLIAAAGFLTPMCKKTDAFEDSNEVEQMFLQLKSAQACQVLQVNEW